VPPPIRRGGCAAGPGPGAVRGSGAMPRCWHEGVSGRGDGEEPPGLELGLGPLAGRRRVPRDAPAGAEVEAAVLDPEGADRHVELALALVGVDPADGAAVDAPI